MDNPNTLRLKDGLLIGETRHLDAVLRQPTAGQLIEASRAAEQVVIGPDGRPALLQSPTLLAYGVLGAQIESIGDYPGPFTINVLGKLSARDLAALQLAAALLDQAAGADLTRVVDEAAQRGRSDGARR